MPPQIATVIFCFGIWVLFALDRQPKGQTSKALWIPVIWLLIAGSRNPGEWLQMQGPSGQGGRYMEGNPVDRAILAALMAIGLIVLFRRSRQVTALLSTNAPVLLFFSYCAISCAWSDFPDVAFKRWFRGMGDVIMVLVILTEADWVAGLKRVLTRVGFVLLPLSVLLIRYYPALGRGYSISGLGTFWTGVTSDKNGLGMICLIFGLGAIWRFRDTYRRRENPRRTKQLVAGGILVATTLYLLWASNSMTSISCFVMAGGLMLAASRWEWVRKPAVVTLLALTAVGLSAFVLFGGAGSVLELLGRNPTLTGRTEVWSIILPFTQNPVLGSGYESFWLGERLVKIGQLTSEGINEAHNGYLEIYLNLGWAGIALLGLIIATGFPKVLRALRLDTESGKLMLAYFILGLIYNFTEAGFKMMNPVWIFFIMAVMAVPGEVLSESPAKLELPPLKTRTRQGVAPSPVSNYPISRLRPNAKGRQKVAR
jgi:exopolysaccharide production protein ExoQ